MAMEVVASASAGGVVDAVSYHDGDMLLGKLTDFLLLAGGEKSGKDLLDPNFFRDGACRRLAVSRQHDDMAAECLQPAYGIFAVWFDFVRCENHAGGASRHKRRRSPFRRRKHVIRFVFRFPRYRCRFQQGRQLSRHRRACRSPCRNPFSGNGAERIYGSLCDGKFFGFGDDGAGKWMLRAFFKGCRNREKASPYRFRLP